MTLHAGRENAARQADVTLHDTREGSPFDVARVAEVQSACDVRGSV